MQKRLNGKDRIFLSCSLSERDVIERALIAQKTALHIRKNPFYNYNCNEVEKASWQAAARVIEAEEETISRILKQL